jgi:hypothetical protein
MRLSTTQRHDFCFLRVARDRRPAAPFARVDLAVFVLVLVSDMGRPPHEMIAPRGCRPVWRSYVSPLPYNELANKAQPTA